jgi:DNA-directed RNA polymerase specialized sigma24 family protein
MAAESSESGPVERITHREAIARLQGVEPAKFDLTNFGEKLTEEFTERLSRDFHNPITVEEAIEQTLFHVWSRLNAPEVDASRSYWAFLYTIAERRAIDLTRKHHRVEYYLSVDSEDKEGTDPAWFHDRRQRTPLEELANDELLNRFRCGGAAAWPPGSEDLRRVCDDLIVLMPDPNRSGGRAAVDLYSVLRLELWLALFNHALEQCPPDVSPSAEVELRLPWLEAELDRAVKGVPTVRAILEALRPSLDAERRTPSRLELCGRINDLANAEVVPLSAEEKNLVWFRWVYRAKREARDKLQPSPTTYQRFLATWLRREERQMQRSPRGARRNSAGRASVDQSEGDVE